MTTSERPSPINPRILDAFGLTEGVLQRIEKEDELETREVIAGLISRFATTIYNRMHESLYTAAEELILFNPEEAKEALERRGITGKTFTDYKVHIGLVEKTKDLPDTLAEAISAAPDSSIRENTRTFLMYFGHAATEVGDWETAVNAYDIATMDQAGGLLNPSNLWLINKIKEPLAETPKRLLGVARHLQSRLDARINQYMIKTE